MENIIIVLVVALVVSIVVASVGWISVSFLRNYNKSIAECRAKAIFICITSKSLEINAYKEIINADTNHMRSKLLDMLNNGALSIMQNENFKNNNDMKSELIRITPYIVLLEHLINKIQEESEARDLANNSKSTVA